MGVDGPSSNPMLCDIERFLAAEQTDPPAIGRAVHEFSVAFNDEPHLRPMKALRFEAQPKVLAMCLQNAARCGRKHAQLALLV